MQQVSIHSAKTHLSKLIQAALNGEEVVIAHRDRPVVRLVPIRNSAFKLGILEGQVGAGPDFTEPLDEDDRALWEGR